MIRGRSSTGLACLRFGEPSITCSIRRSSEPETGSTWFVSGHGRTPRKLSVQRRSNPVDGMKALRLRTRGGYRVRGEHSAGGAARGGAGDGVYRVDAHKRDTLASVVRPDGQL